MIVLPPPPECWDSGMCYHTALPTYISVASVGSRSGGETQDTCSPGREREEPGTR